MISTSNEPKQPRRIIERCSRLDVREHAVLFAAAKHLRAVITTAQGLEIRAEVRRLLPGHDDEALAIHFVAVGEHQDQQIPVTYTQATFGRRRWWLCPTCARRCAILCLPPAEQRWACRRCHDLAYECQQRRGRSFRLRRAREELDRIQAQLARPRLRWATRQRLRARAQVAGAKMRAVLGEVRLAAQREVESLPSL